jgi:hypothetical protein
LFPAILAEGPGCTIHPCCTGERRVITKCITSRVRRECLQLTIPTG